MSLTNFQIEELNDLLKMEHPLGSMVTDLPDYYVEYEDYKRDNVYTDEYWEWNFFYILLVLESEGE